jgi:DNA-binding Lrp family transcriptional regulator
MRLNKNERKTLKLLLTNAKISDSTIANQLRISSQAVGKIRKKLESTLIKSYSLNVDYAKLGIQTFAIALAKITQEGLEEGELEIEQKLLKCSHIISVYRIPSGSSTHIIMYGFKDMAEMEDFFHSSAKKNELHRFIENQQLFNFSHNSLIKNDPVPLLHKAIDALNKEEFQNNSGFREIENFRKRNWE